MLDQPWAADIRSIVTSPETKAIETASILAERCGVQPTVIDATHEIDRTSTGYVDHDRHEALASALFAQPSVSAAGWERAVDAQNRIVTALAPLMAGEHRGNVVVVGHGGVGTLLMSHLLGQAISRHLDQPSQGHYWSVDLESGRLRHRWRPIDLIEPTIESEAPTAPDIVELLDAHIRFTSATSPPEHTHALDLAGLLVPEISFFTARRSGVLLSVGALRDLGSGRAELKSMHTAATARGEGVGRLMVEHLLGVARAAGCHWVGLETGTQQAFAPARRLYEAAGFRECEPFGLYTRNESSVCLGLELAT